MTNENLKLAVCAFIYSPSKNKILSVSRKHNPNDVGLPGGKVEGNELPNFAACRELLEETGYHIENMGPFFICKSDTQYLTTTFIPRCQMHELDELIESSKVSEPSERETGVVSWVSPEMLVENSCFGEYNLKLMRLLWSTKYVPFNIDELLGKDEVDFETLRMPDFGLFRLQEKE